MRGILCATDFSTRSQRALRRAGLLARQVDAELTLLHVVDDDHPPRLAALERREASRFLDEQRHSIAELRGVRCRSAVAAGEAFDGILHEAEAVAADLIVMGSHRKRLGSVAERVLRALELDILAVPPAP
jgi:nucleotide-binding universal stress UspA family protein